jgi:membrane-associated phospholipid phosphatase
MAPPMWRRKQPRGRFRPTVGVVPGTEAPEASTFLRRPADAVAAGIGLIVYLLCALVAASGVPPWEQAAFHAVNDLPDWVQRVAYPAQLLGVLVVPLLPAALAAFLRQWRLCLALALLPVVKYAVEFGVVKRTVDRARPFQSLCGEDPTCGHFRNVPLYGPSFVSGHSIIAAGLAVLLLPYLTRRWQVVVVALAAGVALARVYLGAHNPLDVVGGLAVGVLIGSLLNLAVGVPRRRAARPSLAAQSEA